MSLMPQTPFQWFVPATTGTGMVPAAGYLAKFYAAGTADAKTIYSDFEIETPYPSPSNTATLDANGRALIYLGAGGYKLVVCRPDGTPVYTQDNIAGETTFGTGFVDSFADLLDVNTTLNKYTYIGGYYTPGDGGEGMFYNDVSGIPADGGYVQDSDFDNTKKWFRIPDENGDVRAESFGFVVGLGTTQTAALSAADAYATSAGCALRLPSGQLPRVGNIALNASVANFEQNVQFRGTGSSTVLFNGIVNADGTLLFVDCVVTLANVKQESRPEWFGASIGGSGGDNATAFTKWKTAGAGLFVVPPGTWPHTGTFIPSSSSPTILYGTVGVLPVGAYYPLGYTLNTPTFTLDGDAAINGNGTVEGNWNVALSLGVDGDADILGNANVTGDVDCATLLADDAAIVGDIQAENIDVDDHVFAGGPVAAGQDASKPGNVQARAGSSALTFNAAGQPLVEVGAGTLTLPANAIGSGDSLEIFACGTASGDASLTVRIRFGTQPALDITLGTDCTEWFAKVHVIRTGATTGFATGFLTTNSVAEYGQCGADIQSSVSVTWANSNSINTSLSGTATGQSMLAARIFPA